MLKFFVLSFLLCVGLVLLVVSKILENMVRPVTELSKQMERTEYGKQQPIHIVHTGDEIEIYINVPGYDDGAVQRRAGTYCL